MSDIFTPTSSTLEIEKQDHFDRIYEMKVVCKLEMFDYINKYVLNERNRLEVFIVAQQSLLADVNKQGWFDSYFIYEQIIKNEGIFSKQSDEQHCNEEVFTTNRINSRN